MSENINTEKTVLAWLDDSSNDIQDHTVAEEQLRLLNSNFKMLRNKDDCTEYVKSQSTDTRITLIVNGSLGQQIVPDIHPLPQIITIYVYCMNKEKHDKWAKNFDKVKGVFTDFNELKTVLQPIDTDKNQSIAMEVSTTDSSEETTIQIHSTYELDCRYMISDSCFDYLIRMKTAPTEKDDFIAICQDALQGNARLLAILQECKESYTANRAISWLNRDPFFHGFIDNIFKMTYIDGMYLCRVFIHDIHKQLEQHKCTSTIEVYRSEPMSDEQFQYLKSFNGKMIAMKLFFMTNSDRQKALSYTAEYSSNNEIKRILFIIEANPQIEHVKPFAKIGSIGHDNDSDDVLFMIGSVFKITEIQDEKDGIINVKMSLCVNDDMNSLKQIFDQIKYQYMYENGETDIIGFGQFLCNIGSSMHDNNLSDIGEKFIRTCLDPLAADYLVHSRCYDALGTVYLSKGDLDSSLDLYQKSLDIKKEKLDENDLNLAESYKNLALVYFRKKDSIQALDYFQKLLKIWKQCYGDDYIDLIFCYTNMALIYETQENLTEQISCYYQALALMVKHKSITEASYAALYNNLGNAYTTLKHYHLALGYYNASLEMKSKIHTSVNPSIALTYKNIGLVHKEMNNIQQSKENLGKAADIYRELYAPENPNITDIEELIRNLPNTEQS